MLLVRITTGSNNTDHRDASDSYKRMCLMSNRVLILMMGTSAEAYRRVGKNP